MAEHPDATRYLAAQALFELGNHSFLHPHLRALPDDRVRQELEWTQAFMYSLTGRQALLFRAPYGEIDERVARLAAQLGLTVVQYDLASGAPDARSTADGLGKAVLQGARRRFDHRDAHERSRLAHGGALAGHHRRAASARL